MNTNQRLTVPLCLGIDQQLPPEKFACDLLQNVTYERKTRGWDTRIGYESYLKVSGSTFPLRTDLPYRVDSVFCWNKFQGRQEFLICEGSDATKSGRLLLVKPKTSTVYVLDDDRMVPSANDFNTQYIPFGNYLIVVNGTDKPIKMSLWPFDYHLSAGTSPVYRFGFQGTPSPPAPWGVDVSTLKVSPSRNVSMYVGATSREGGLGALDSSDSKYDGEYKWKVSFINESGSESPLSPASTVVKWSDSDTFQVCMLEIPRGPKGTVARRVYRTRDMTGGYLSAFYFVGQVDNNIEPVFYDHISDTALVSEAPSELASISLPVPKARFGAAYNNCLFLEAGSHSGTRVHFSTVGTVDQFGQLDYLDVGSRDSGSLTAMHAYYDSLLLFREKGIDIVRGSYPNFTVSSLVSGVGCVGPDAVVELPGIGVLFMSPDGVYAVTGGVEGGSEVSVQSISDGLHDTLRTINRSLLARCVARYSNKWKEAHFYVPGEGGDRNSLGIVYHTDKQSWSVRKGFPVGCLTTTRGGDFVFGHSFGTLNNAFGEAGLFVISKIRHAGYNNQADQDEAITAANPVTSIYRSTAHDFMAPEVKKFVKYVYLYVLTVGGDNDITMEYRLDDSYTGTVTETRQMQRPDHPDQGVFDTAIYNTDIWERGLVTEIRFPVPEKACDRFQFQISTTNDMVLIGYTIDYSMSGTKVITGQSTSTVRSRA
mgnify:CR=1 FL=1